MTRDELIEEAARIIHADCARGLAVYPMHTARKIADLFYGALKEPTEKMVIAAGKAWGITVTSNEYENMEDEWRLMLAASPLAPEGGGT
ncbi:MULTISPECIES: hypothetical protein [unclassified Pseudochrobactrum]|uniref:hypothetical protein n=1 Tax=unclassified Pseudochrobactrum TaxID=2647013 RepID=UPI000951119D|nr:MULTISPECIES: hypothetical protein [unclassified Pseudochrobactrum]MDM8346230.1 hypothetical protein [Pseudochrobactrum sp. sp1633]